MLPFPPRDFVISSPVFSLLSYSDGPTTVRSLQSAVLLHRGVLLVLHCGPSEVRFFYSVGFHYEAVALKCGVPSQGGGHHFSQFLPATLISTNCTMPVKCGLPLKCGHAGLTGHSTIFEPSLCPHNTRSPNWHAISDETAKRVCLSDLASPELVYRQTPREFNGIPKWCG